MKRPIQGVMVLIAVFLTMSEPGYAASSQPLPNLDRRPLARSIGLKAEQGAALRQLRERLPHVQVDFDPLLQSPRRIMARDGFLTGPNAQGRAVTGGAVTLFGNEPHRATKLFMAEHRALFGFGPEALDAAAIKSEYTGAHNGLHTVVWEQQLEGIPIFEALLISHTTKRLELATLSSRFVIEPARAADAAHPKHALLVTAPPVQAADAVVRAAQEVGDPLSEITNSTGRKGARQHQRFRAHGLKDEADARLVWLPMDAERLRLCWEIFFVSGSRDEMFQSLIDVETGEVLLRNSRTSDLAPAIYNVYTSESPTPFSPGFATPSTNQPPYVSRVLVTTSALSTNASPAGWINDGDNETRGNNVDAHLDRNADNQPDLPRPQGSPERVFDFPIDLSQSPTNYSAAAVVNLFYWCNWMHDRLYDLGFTEAAGNFQET
ncbi:MAG TPA: M36 family metallopeptidase, partial [Candidatus Saccharimonadales bacterium]|nr:M36 family metallopeptidase [Candidatus Saccharimonadales bacterium]